MSTPYFLADWRLIFHTFWLHVLQISGSTLGTARNGKDEAFYAGTRTQKTTAYQVYACKIMIHTPGRASKRRRKGAREGGGEVGGGFEVLQTQTLFQTKIPYFPIYVSVKYIPPFRLSEQNG